LKYQHHTCDFRHLSQGAVHTIVLPMLFSRVAEFFLSLILTLNLGILLILNCRASVANSWHGYIIWR